MRISDWSSDVCSSDLVREGIKLALSFDALPGQSREGEVGAISPLIDVGGRSILLRAHVPNADGALRPGDRKSVVSGKSVSVRVDLGGGRIIKKQIDENDKDDSTT